MLTHNGHALVIEGRLVAEGDHAVVVGEGSLVGLGDVTLEGGDAGLVAFTDDGKLMASRCTFAGGALEPSENALVLESEPPPSADVAEELVAAFAELEQLRRVRAEEKAEADE